MIYPPFPNKVSIGQKYKPAMEIRNQMQADDYFERCVEHTMKRAKVDREEAEKIERANIGYFAGYYSNEVRLRVEQLFGCAHPVFGEIAKNGAPTPDEALRKGYEMAAAEARARLQVGK